MSQISIEFATPNDVPEIFNMIKGLAEFEKLSHEVTGSVDELQQSLFGDKPECEVIIAKSQGKAMGFALFFHNYSTFLTRKGIYLEDLFVYPEHRGKGIGLTLLKKLAKIAKQRNCARLDWSVLDWNEKAINFYESLGAKPMTGWLTYRLTGEKLQQLAELP